MTIEFVGAIEIDPPLTHGEAEAIRCHARPDDDPKTRSPSPWWPSRDGRRLLLNRPVSPDDGAEWLRRLTTEVATVSVARLEGLVVGHDSKTGEVVMIRAGKGRITRRTLRQPHVRTPSNVIDFAARRRLTG